MVNVISAEVMATLDMEVGAGGASKYPWDSIPVGGGFSIPLCDLKQTDYRPTPPVRLKEAGVKFISRKTPVGGVPSIVLKRVA